MQARLALTLALLLAACSRDEAAPSSEQNRQLDSAENLLDQAPNELEAVDEELPEQP